MEFVTSVIPKNKLAQYVNEFRKVIENGKGVDNGVVVLEPMNRKVISDIEILQPIKNILVDLYEYLDEIKYELNRNARKFVKNNIDLISQIVLIAAMEGVGANDLIDDNVLLFVLSFVNRISTLTLNMSVNNFMMCCGKVRNTCLKF